MDAVGGASLSSSDSHRWRDVRLGDLCDHVTVGHVGKMSDQYVDRGVPLLRSQDVRPFQLALNHAKKVSPEFHSRLRKSALLAGDVVIVRTGYPGTAAVVPPNVTELNCADLVVIRPRGDLDPWFLAAHFNSRHGRALVSGQLVGVAQQHFNVGVAANMQLSIPGSRDQRRIGAIVFAFSELIEINERRIELLEDLARSLYREWFVRFRFPGHEEVELVDSELGPVPEGWEVQRLGDIAAVNDESFKATDLPDPFLYLDISAVGVGRIEAPSVIAAAEAPGRARRRVRDGDVVWATVRPNRRAHGLIHDPPANLVASTGLAVLSPAAVPSSFLYEHAAAQSFTDFLVSQATGSAYPAVRPNDFCDAPVLVPPHATLDRFDAVVDRALRTASALKSQCRQLAATRDLLLPRLVTGRLDISDVDLGALAPTEAE
jgi:type I restriction enzyme S subunit